MSGLGHKMLRSRITKTRKGRRGKIMKRRGDAFECGRSLVKADTGELAEKENLSFGSDSDRLMY